MFVIYRKRFAYNNTARLKRVRLLEQIIAGHARGIYASFLKNCLSGFAITNL